MPSQADELAARVQRFAGRIFKFVKTLARDPASASIARQLADSGGGMSSNYRAARRARSRREFVAKLGVVVEEADETEGWLEDVEAAKLASGVEFDWLLNESHELRAIFVQSVKTARANLNRIAERHIPRSSNPKDPQIPKS